mgnify:CR=1 FL=1
MAESSNKIQPSQSAIADLMCSALPGVFEKVCRTEVAKLEAKAKSKDTYQVAVTLPFMGPVQVSQAAQSQAAEDKKAASADGPTHDAAQEKSARRFILPPWMARLLFFETPQQRLDRISRLLRESMNPFSFPEFP